MFLFSGNKIIQLEVCNIYFSFIIIRISLNSEIEQFAVTKLKHGYN